MEAMKSFLAKEFQAIDFFKADFEKYWIDPENRVLFFLSLFLNKKYFNSIVVLANKFLNDRKSFGIGLNEPFKIIEDISQAESLKENIIEACVGSGHMSILFLVKPNTGLLECYIEKKCYVSTGTACFESQASNGPLKGKELDEFIHYLDYFKVGKDADAIIFSHDADCFYKIPG